MTKVWRIEDGKGHGVCEHSGSELCKMYRSCIKRHKCYGIDMSLEEEVELALKGIDFRFGFTSIDEVRNYFPLDVGREKMKEDGGELWEYEVEEIEKEDKRQCIFNYETAKKVRRWDLVSLKELGDEPLA